MLGIYLNIAHRVSWGKTTTKHPSSLASFPSLASTVEVSYLTVSVSKELGIQSQFISFLLLPLGSQPPTRSTEWSLPLHHRFGRGSIDREVNNLSKHIYALSPIKGQFDSHMLDFYFSFCSKLRYKRDSCFVLSPPNPCFSHSISSSSKQSKKKSNVYSKKTLI